MHFEKYSHVDPSLWPTVGSAIRIRASWQGSFIFSKGVKRVERESRVHKKMYSKVDEAPVFL